MQKTMFTSWLRRAFYRTAIGIGLALILAQSSGVFAVAQTSTASTWTPPVNLSQSGGASKPALMLDSDGRFHAIWQDEYAGFIYRVGDGTTWEAAQNILVPFTNEELKLRFSTTPAGSVVAFWINADEELYSSTVRLANIANPGAWSAPIQWASGVRDFAVAVDDTGALHLAYLRGEASQNLPAGIYAVHSTENAPGWTTPVLIYTSPYFRGLTAEDAHLVVASTAAGDQNIVYIAWDLLPRRNLWLARSDDQGVTWGEASEIVRPSPIFGFEMPYEIEIIAQEEQVLALWKLGRPGNTCTTYAMQASDRGITWDAPQQLFGAQAGCPDVLQIIDSAEGEIILFAQINSQAYLMARNESGWSIPQYQHELSQLFDPETQRPLKLQDVSMIKHGDQLYLIGSTLLEDGGDIWLATRNLDDLAAWFTSDSSWSTPQEIANKTGTVQSTALVVDKNGHVHAFWNITRSSGIALGAEIFYAVWDGITWSTPVSILESPRLSIFLQSVTISPEDTIFLTWGRHNSRGLSEGLTVSWANHDEASSTSAWVSTEALPASHISAADSEIHFVGAGQIRMMYVLPLNENRGVYTISSSDSGRTWSEPALVAEAASQDWQMVGDPHFSVSGASKVISVMWTVYSLPPYSRPLALYAAGSSDGGQTWSEPETVAEGWIELSQAAQTSDGAFHRLWLVNEESVQNLWHQTSTDYGLSWSTPANLSITTHPPVFAARADNLGRLHLVMITAETARSPRLQYWLWQSDKWQGNGGLRLPADLAIEVNSLAAAFTPQDIFGVTYAGKLPDLAGGELPARLYFAQRGVERLLVTPTSLQQPTKRATEPRATRTPVPPTATPLPANQTQPSPSSPKPSSLPTAAPEANNPWAGAILAGGALLVAALVAAAVYWIMRIRK